MSGKELSKDVFCDFNCESIDYNYYKAYDKRYRQVYEYDYLWSSKSPTPDVFETIKKYNIPVSASILDLGCGEDAILYFFQIMAIMFWQLTILIQLLKNVGN